MEKKLIAYDYIGKAAYEKKIVVGDDVAEDTDLYSAVVNNECRVFGGQISGFKAHAQAEAKGDVITVKDIDSYIKSASENYGGLIYMVVDDFDMNIHNASALNKSTPLYISIENDTSAIVFNERQKNTKCSRAFLMSDRPSDFTKKEYLAFVNKNPYFVLLFPDKAIADAFMTILGKQRSENIQLIKAIAK